MIQDFVEKRTKILNELSNKAEKAKSYFAIIDFVDVGLVVANHP